MNWQRCTQSFARPHGRSSSRFRYRPSLFALEDRIVLSPVMFSVDPTQSSVALSGTVGGSAILEQGPGSLVTTFEGSFLTDIDDSPGGTGIVFYNSGNDLFADNSGAWQPRADGSSGAEDANYGGQFNYLGLALAALRNLNVGADTGGSGLPLNDNGDGSFGFSSGQTLFINTGSLAYSHPLAGHGAFDLGGINAPNQASDGLLVDNGDGTFVISAPVSLSFSGTISSIPYTLNINGIIVANGASVGPSPRAGNDGRTGLDQALGADLVSALHAADHRALADGVPSQANSWALSLDNQALPAPTQLGRSQGQADTVAGAILQTTPLRTAIGVDPLSTIDSVFHEFV